MLLLKYRDQKGKRKRTTSHHPFPFAFSVTGRQKGVLSAALLTTSYPDLYFPTSQIAAHIHGGWHRLMGLSPLRGSLRAARRQKYHYAWRESWRQLARAAGESWTRSLPCLAVFYGLSPQVVLAQSFPSLVPSGMYVYAGIYFSRCCGALSAPLRAKSRRILSIVSRSSPFSVLASRSSNSCCCGIKYFLLWRYSSIK